MPTFQANIEDIHRATSVSQTLKQTVFVAKLDDGQSAHNYSIQTVNCTRLAEELLRKEMAKVRVGKRTEAHKTPERHLFFIITDSSAEF